MGAAALVLAAMLTLGCENATEEKTNTVLTSYANAGDYVQWDGGNAYKVQIAGTLPNTPVTVGVHTYKVISGSGFFAGTGATGKDYTGITSGAENDLVELIRITSVGTVSTVYDILAADGTTGTANKLTLGSVYKFVRKIPAAAVFDGDNNRTHLYTSITKDAAGRSVTYSTGDVVILTGITVATDTRSGEFYDVVSTTTDTGSITFATTSKYIVESVSAASNYSAYTAGTDGKIATYSGTTGDYEELSVLTTTTGVLSTVYDLLTSTSEGTYTPATTILYKKIRLVPQGALATAVGATYTAYGTTTAKLANGNALSVAVGDALKLTAFTTSGGSSATTAYDVIASVTASAGTGTTTLANGSTYIVEGKITNLSSAGDGATYYIVK
ncbi:MAG: hypothetical protein LBR23_02065 [Spirochaetaceae bacterium]|nr:hypothetical protein [Spirochaetaceae bacterium]